MTIQPTDQSPKEAVDTMLGLARLPMAADEYERLLRIYPLLREQAAALRFAEARDAEPAVIYHAR
jgi:hypothetical protein